MYVRLIQLIVLCLFFFLESQVLVEQSKRCGDLGLSFHGEIGYARTIETGERKGEVERIRLIRPLGPTYGPNSNDW